MYDSYIREPNLQELFFGRSTFGKPNYINLHLSCELFDHGEPCTECVIINIFPGMP